MALGRDGNMAAFLIVFHLPNPAMAQPAISANHYLINTTSMPGCFINL